MVTKLKTAVKKAVKSVMPKKKVGTTKAVSKKAVPSKKATASKKQVVAISVATAKKKVAKAPVKRRALAAAR
ncbi:MAG: hypothetical protein JSR76_07340 [Verrucomicrobia bacterium]|nr:hypothetical protein [Verrucomicrobiota bacterium]